MIRPNFFDWWVYRLFYWRWNPIMMQRPDLLRAFVARVQAWRLEQESEGTP